MGTCKSSPQRSRFGESESRAELVALRDRPGPPPERPGVPDAPDPGPADDTAEAPPEEGPICCGQCLLPVTSSRERCSVGGAHRHVFANPHGFVYEIGCFANAPGCAPVGPATPDFSWFPGTTWRIVVCARCGLHLGWQYAGQAGHGPFFGLILPRLRQMAPDGAPDDRTT